MKLKTQNIMRTLDSNHRVIIKCDIPGEKIKQVTITEGKGCYTVGTSPRCTLRQYSKQDVINFLDENSMYIETWKAW